MRATSADPSLDGCNENLVVTSPDKISELHRSFLEAGADIIETNSFGSTSVVLAEYGLERQARELNRISAQLARAQADAFSTPERPRFVAGSMGPTTKSISVTGGVTFDHLADVLSGAGGRADRGRRRSAAAGNGAGRDQLQGWLDRYRARDCGYRCSRRYRRLGHHRDDGDAARWPGYRGVLYCDCQSRSPVDRAELRYRSGLHDRPLAHARRNFTLSGRLRAECGLARRRRQLQRNPRIAVRQARPLRRQRMGQPGRRMLRHHARAYRALARDGGGSSAAPKSHRRGARSSRVSSHW